MRIARSIAAATAVIALVLAAASAAAGTPARSSGTTRPAGSDPTLWGWVVARHPGQALYTPDPKDRGNSTGGTNTVERLGLGGWRVKFVGLGFPACADADEGCEGTFDATALSTRQRDCFVSDWHHDTSDMYADVFCTDRHMNLVDAAFSANFLRTRDDHGTLGYFYDAMPSAPSHEPPGKFNYDSTSLGLNSVTRMGVGRYQVFLPGLYAGSRGNVQISGPLAVCRVIGRSDQQKGTGGGLVDVLCRDLAGQLLDSSFWFIYTEGVGLTGIVGHPAAYVWANRPTTASYHPAPAFRSSTAGTIPTVTRSAVGSYLVALPGMPLRGTAQVTAVGAGKGECQLSGIGRTGPPQRIGVRCFGPNGGPVDSQFSLTYTR